jgi:four helix bundle protein
MQDFKKLKTWDRAHALTLSVYKPSRSFPKEETYGLTSQMRRSAASIPTNIAEGCGTASKSEMARFLQYAMASASELEYELVLARDLAYAEEPAMTLILTEVHGVKRMLSSLMQKVRSS